MLIREMKATDNHQLKNLFREITLFTDDEIEVLNELLDSSLKDLHNEERDYFFDVMVEEDKLVAFVCYGKTPMTLSTYDLYWIGTHPHFANKGLGKKLVDHLVLTLKQKAGTLLRIETSSKDSYKGTQAFYKKVNFELAANIRDFYAPKDDLMIYTYRI